MEETDLSEKEQELDNDNVHEQKRNFRIWDAKVIGNLVISSFFIIIGLYKLLVYSYDEYGDKNINAYVGGDAYNYIINGNYAIAYFVLALIFTILGCTFFISNVLQNGEQRK